MNFQSKSNRYYDHVVKSAAATFTAKFKGLPFKVVAGGVHGGCAYGCAFSQNFMAIVNSNSELVTGVGPKAVNVNKAVFRRQDLFQF